MATRREKRLAKAEKLVQRGRLEAAIEELRDVLKESPDDTRTLNRVGDLYARLNRVDEAVELFSQAAERFSKEGFFVKAIAIYKKILRLDPTRMVIYESLAELYQLQGLTSEARGQYQVVADYYERADMPQAMIKVYRKLVELDPTDTEAKLRFADILSEAGNSEESLETFGEVGTALLDDGQSDDAVGVFMRAIEADSSDLQFIIQTVLQLQATDRPELVERFLEAAIERNPEAEKARELLETVATADPAPIVAEEESPAATGEAEEAEAAAEEPEVEVVEAGAAAEAPPEAPEEGSGEFEIELDSFEEEQELKPEPASVPELKPEPTPEAEPEDTLEDMLVEADALAGYGLTDKAVRRLEKALAMEPAHLGTYRRLIGIQLDAQRHTEVMRLAAEAASAALEGGDPGTWRQIVGDLQERGFTIEGSKIMPPKAPPVQAEVPAELLVDDVEEKEAATETESATEESAEVAVETLEPAKEKEPEGELGWLDEIQDTPAEPAAPAAPPEAASEAEAPAEAESEPEPASEEDVFDEAGEEGGADFFDLGAELEQEFEAEGETTEEPATLDAQSVEEIVQGFKEGMAQVLSPEAYETHYNLGIAYREMGLVDEAIGEFQLASKDPRYLVECCSMLGSCFQEKDFADLAIKWYRKGLESPQVSEEESLGLLYEMGNLHLLNGDTDQAGDAFTEIYGVNSNFRDVVAKLEDLKREG